MDKLSKIISDFMAFIASIPPHWWYIIGAGVAIGLGTSITLAVVTYRKKFKDAEKYAKEFVSFLLIAIAFAMSTAVYIVTHSAEIGQLLSIPYLADFAKTVLPAWGIALGVAEKFYNLGGSRLYQNFYDRIAPKLAAWSQKREAIKEATKQPVFKTSLPKPYVVVKTSDAEDEMIFASDEIENK